MDMQGCGVSDCKEEGNPPKIGERRSSLMGACARMWSYSLLDIDESNKEKILPSCVQRLQYREKSLMEVKNSMLESKDLNEQWKSIIAEGEEDCKDDRIETRNNNK